MIDVTGSFGALRPVGGDRSKAAPVAPIAESSGAGLGATSPEDQVALSEEAVAAAAAEADARESPSRDLEERARSELRSALTEVPPEPEDQERIARATNDIRRAGTMALEEFVVTSRAETAARVDRLA